ncbi:MAG TPA: hypothetical protein VLL48_11260 [Longimicrobiales bacterium]|nr:hypothetical protein [Longimicrobiales bacterium]
MRSLIALTLAVALAGCDRGTDVDFGGEAMGPDLHAIVSEDGAVKMGLTREFVYFALSDSARAQAQAELDEDAEQSFLGGIMRGLVGKALDFRAKYAVSTIRDIRWEDGRMQVVFNDPDRRLDEGLEIGDGQPVTEAFTEDAVLSFAEAFRAVKGESAPESDPAG